MATIVKVIISNIVKKIDLLYDYIYPFDDLPIGKRVIVPFGKANAPRKALVLESSVSDDTEGLKSVIDTLDSQPIVTADQIKLLHFLKEHYFITYYRGLGCLIPTGLDYKVEKRYCYTGAEFGDEFKDLVLFVQRQKNVSFSQLSSKQRIQLKEGFELGIFAEEISSKRNLGDVADKMLSLALSPEEAEAYLSKLPSRYQGQRDILRILLDYPSVSAKEALYMTGCSVSSLHTLEKNGVIHIYLQPRLRTPYTDFVKNSDKCPIELNEGQEQVYKDIASKTAQGFSVHLIHGVTGSGKTHVYMKLIDQTVSQKKSVLFLIPEISLTPQTLSRFFARYGEKVAVIHSGLTMGQRLDEWKKIKQSDVSVVVGTRSAVFAPINHLGLIIMDEEHEGSYKSESSPKFHARDIARFLCKEANASLVLGSATPSLESFSAAKKGKYYLHSLTDRFNLQPLPEVEMVDMREETPTENFHFLSEILKTQLAEVISKKKQAILFLNRRGAHTGVICQRCGYVLKCTSCGIAMTYHSANDRCICHFCSYSIKMVNSCPECDDKHIRMRGYGTQYVEQNLISMFPNARILRMDMDTVTNYLSYQSMLSDFADGKYDILLGTQMVAKGLDFPNVTLVGVLQADMSLYVDDFRAGERTFSLLTQVCGRSGRSKEAGKAVIQSYSPEHEVLLFAKQQDYLSFYEYEIKFRKAINYPPFCDIALFTVTADSQNLSKKAAIALFKCLEIHAIGDASDIPLRLLRPGAPRIAKINNKYRMQMLVKCRNSSKFRKIADASADEIMKQYRVLISIDINPMSF